MIFFYWNDRKKYLYLFIFIFKYKKNEQIKLNLLSFLFFHSFQLIVPAGSVNINVIMANVFKHMVYVMAKMIVSMVVMKNNVILWVCYYDHEQHHYLALFFIDYFFSFSLSLFLMMTKTKILLHAIRPVYVYIEVFGVMDDQIVQCSMKMNLDVSRYFIIINNDDDHDKIFIQF